MGKALFKAESLLNLKNLNEAHNKIYKNTFIRYYIIIAIEIVLIIINYRIGDTSTWNFVLFWLIIILLLLRSIKKSPKKQIDISKLKYHTDILHEEITITEKSINIHTIESGWKYEIYYDQIIWYKETNNLDIIIAWLPKALIIIDKNTFSIWKEKDLKDFINWKIEENKKSKRNN